MALTSHTLGVRDGLVGVLKGALGETVRTFTKYDGRITVDMLERYSVRCPALILTRLGVKSSRASGYIKRVPTFGIVVLTRSTASIKRGDQADLLSENIDKLLLDPESNKLSSLTPQEVEWQPIYVEKLEEKGLFALLGAWEERIEVPFHEDYDDLPDFARLWSEVFEPGEVAGTPETGTALVEQQIDLETV